MKVVVRIDAAPGFEDTVEAALSDVEGVFNVAVDNEGNFDLVAGLEADDANGLQDTENAIRQESGVQGVKRLDDPEASILERLQP